MMHSVSLFIFTVSTLFLILIFSPTTQANTNVEVSNNGESTKTNVNIKTNTGGNTVCVNGNCTTTGENTGTSKVCVNGVCHTSENGDVNYQSDDGNTKVEIKTDNEDTAAVVKSDEPTVTPEVFKAIEGAAIKDKVKETVAKEIDEASGFDILKFLQAELESFKDFVTLEFLFTKE